MDVKCASGKSSEGNEKHYWNWKKWNPCYIVEGSLDVLFPTVVWK